MQTSILFLTRRLSPAIGGMETQANEMVRYFAHHDQIRLVSVATLALEASGYRGIVASAPTYDSPVPITFLTPNSITDPQELCKEIAEKLPEDGILITDTLFWIKVFSAVRKQFPKLRIIFSTGGNDVIYARDGVGTTLHEKQQYIVDTLNVTTDIVFCLSEFIKERYTVLGIEKAKMHVVGGGVDLGLFHPGTPEEKLVFRKEFGVPDSSLLILNACRFVPFKGLYYLLQAFSQLTVLPQAYLLLVGDGPERKKTEELARALKIEKNVIFTGSVTWEEVAKYFVASDIFCSTPILYIDNFQGQTYVHTETMGRTFCEAAAAGLPTVATTVGGVPEIVEDGVTGTLVEEKNIQAITTALEFFCFDVEKRMQYGVNARQKAEKEFSWSSFFEAYVPYFTQTL